MSPASQNLMQSPARNFYIIGHAFCIGRLGHFLITSLDTCIYSFERLFKRLELLTKDTVVVIPPERHLILEISNEIANDTTVTSPILNAESIDPPKAAPQIESLTPGNSTLPIGKEQSPVKVADPKPEKDYLAESMPSSNLTIVYANLTGLEKLFVLMFDAFILCPVNAAVAFLRFLRTIFRDFEECVPSSKIDMKIASLLSKTILMNRLQTLFSDAVKPGHLDDSVIRLEYTNIHGLSGHNEEFLDKEMDSVNFYWEENDSDYKPVDASSDTCTESESDIDISVEEVNHILKTVEKSQEMFPLKSEDQSIQLNGKDNCPNSKELAPIKKKRKRKRRNRKSKPCMTKTVIPDNPALPS